MISFLLALIIFFFSSLNILRLIQLKEYFIPSILAHFDYPSSYLIFIRRREIFLWLLWALFLVLAFLGIEFKLKSKFWVLFLIILLLFLFYRKKGQLKLLRWTIKFIFISFLVILINWRIVTLSQNNIFVVFLLFTSSFQFLISLFSTYLGNVITNIYAQILFKQAKIKIQQWRKKDPQRKIIGITGSHGKTSTKEILAQILSEKYKVLKSPLRLNAEIGLSQFILSSDLEESEILVLELGARKRGEIATMVEIFNPDIAFLTGIGSQHLATFGSLENIILGKKEIFQKMTPSGIAFINGNDEYSKYIYEALPIPKKYLYGTSEGSFYAKNINTSLEKTIFDFVYPKGEIKLETNLIGEQFIENLIGALACAYILGIQPDQIKEKLKNLSLLPHQFEVVKKSHPVIIDDSYNSNLIGVIKGTKFFLSLPIKYKIVFFAGILELGVETPRYYKQLIDVFRGFEKVILTFKDFSEVFEEHLYNKVIIYKNQKLEEIFKNYPKEELGILILGRIPNKLLNEIYKEL